MSPYFWLGVALSLKGLVAGVTLIKESKNVSPRTLFVLVIMAITLPIEGTILMATHREHL